MEDVISENKPIESTKSVKLEKHYVAVTMEKKDVETKEEYWLARNALQEFYEKKKYLSLSAPQLGIGLRMVAVEVKGKLTFLANPVVFMSGNRRSMVYENDLTSKIEGYVSRPRKCTVGYIDETLHWDVIIPKKTEKNGLLHAIDYLNNISYVENISRNHQNNIKEVVEELRRNDVNKDVHKPIEQENDRGCVI